VVFLLHESFDQPKRGMCLCRASWYLFRVLTIRLHCVYARVFDV
jgi:hypothetical protein